MVCSLLRRPDYAAQTVEFVNAPTTLLEIGNAPPKAAIRLLRETIPADEEGKAKWRQQATIAAIMGSCPRSHESLLSGGQFSLSRRVHSAASLHGRDPALAAVHGSSLWERGNPFPTAVERGDPVVQHISVRWHHL